MPLTKKVFRTINNLSVLTNVDKGLPALECNPIITDNICQKIIDIFLLICEQCRNYCWRRSICLSQETFSFPIMFSYSSLINLAKISVNVWAVSSNLNERFPVIDTM